MELADLEYHYLIMELKEKIRGSHVSKIYQLSDHLFKIVFSSKVGKYTLLVQLPQYATLTTRVLQSPETPSNFIMALRKRIMGGYVEDVNQPGFERILLFDITNAGKKYRLVIELFSNGNIILCNELGIIEVVYRSEEWRDRRIARGVEYNLPPSKISPYNALPKHISLNGKKTLFAGILSQVSLAPKYLEEVFFRVGLDTKHSTELSENDRERLISVMKEVCSEARFCIYKKESKMVEYSVCSLSKYNDFEQVSFSAVSELIDVFYEPVLETVSRKDELREKEKIAVENMRKYLEQIRKEADDCKRCGDLIYSNYELLERLVAEVQLRRKEQDVELINKLLSEIYPGARFDREKNRLIVEFNE